MKDRIYLIVIAILLLIGGYLWYKNHRTERDFFEQGQVLKKQIIKSDSLVKVTDGFYQKLVADTLTRKQLRSLAEKITGLENREVTSVTTTIIQPKEIVKTTDGIISTTDSLFIEDYYPKKENYFLRYTNRLSKTTEKGISRFSFKEVRIDNVVTKKDNGLYQVDFKGPDFLELRSLDIQMEPIIENKRDNWGTLIGIEYGRNFEVDEQVFGINAYQRYKKVYFGGGISTDETAKVGIKVEF